MLYGLYAGTFFCNVLFYMGMLQAVPGDSVAAANLGYMFLCSAGLFAYGFGHERLGAKGGACLGGALGLSGLGAVLLWQGAAPLALAMALFALPYGYVTGQVAHLAARLVPVARQGRFIGISLGLCNLALYFVLYLPWGWQLVPLLGAALLSALLLRKLERRPAPQAEGAASGALPLGDHLPLAVLTAAALGLLVGLDDSVFFPRFEAYEETFSTSRLFTAGGYFLAGLVADLFPMYLPLVALAAKAVPLFVRAGSESLALAVLSYTDAFFTGALIILVVRIFFLLAPATKNPRLWAGMGRGIEMPASALGAAVGLTWLEGQSLSLIVACHTAMLLACAMLFYRGLMIYAEMKKGPSLTVESLNLKVDDEINCLTAGEDMVTSLGELPLYRQGRTIQELQQDYCLTGRETEVLEVALQGGNIADIAASLCVTERTVKFHIGNLLKKTGCKNQKELKEKFQ